MLATKDKNPEDEKKKDLNSDEKNKVDVRNELAKDMPTVLVDIKSPDINGNNESEFVDYSYI